MKTQVKNQILMLCHWNHYKIIFINKVIFVLWNRFFWLSFIHTSLSLYMCTCTSVCVCVCMQMFVFMQSCAYVCSCNLIVCLCVCIENNLLKKFLSEIFLFGYCLYHYTKQYFSLLSFIPVSLYAWFYFKFHIYLLLSFQRKLSNLKVKIELLVYL